MCTRLTIYKGEKYIKDKVNRQKHRRSLQELEPGHRWSYKKSQVLIIALKKDLIFNSLLSTFLAVLREQCVMDVGQDSALRDCDAREQFIQLWNKCSLVYESWLGLKLRNLPESWRIAKVKWRGLMRCLLLAWAALPPSSRISATRYSKTAAQ